jgi:hypothetical protein
MKKQKHRKIEVLLTITEVDLATSPRTHTLNESGAPSPGSTHMLLEVFSHFFLVVSKTDIS